MNEVLEIHNVYEKLKTAQKDPAVGIGIAKLVGDKAFGLYAAEIAPFKRVGAHYHMTGLETYQIFEGSGLIYTGTPSEDKTVTWKEPVAVKKGDFFAIQAKEVHQLVNDSSSPLIVIFGCSPSHLGEDRIVVDGIKA